MTERKMRSSKSIAIENAVLGSSGVARPKKLRELDHQKMSGFHELEDRISRPFVGTRYLR